MNDSSSSAGRGRYIVLEGPEGVGKTTQILELANRLQTAGLPVRLFREPDSQSDLTARAIRQLTQDPRYPMNTRTEVLLYNAARAQSLNVIKQSVEQGIICVVDRNYLTTLSIQYYGRGDVPDYETINSIIRFAVGDIEPDLCIVLDAPAEVLVERAKTRGSGQRFDALSFDFLERVRNGYLWEAKQRNFPVVDANQEQQIITDTIWRLASHVVAARKPSVALQPKQTLKFDSQPVGETAAKTTDKAESTAHQPEPYLTKHANGSFTITESGKKWLEDAVTDSEGPVYATKAKLESITAAAAMARLSRRGDDMRVTVLDEFADKTERDDKLIQRVISAYGDDSVQQLIGQHIVVEDASIILTKKLEWGRLAAYLEQSTRYIYFDQKNAKGHYKYVIPKSLKKSVRSEYIKQMDSIFDNYSTMVHRLTEHVRANSDTPKAERDTAWKGATRAQACDAVRAVLPLATKATVGIFASGQALESLIMHLLSDDLTEARDTGAAILREARKVIPSFLERADKPERGGATIAYRANTHHAMRDLARSSLSRIYDDGSGDLITLTDVWPKNETDIVADMLYEFSDTPLTQLRAAVAEWTYDQKLTAMQTYFGERLNRRHRPGRALEKIHYSFDIVCDYGSFKDLSRHRIVDDLEWQMPTPRYGFAVPKLVEEAGLVDEFEACFDTSLQLHSLLVSSGDELEAQYAVLHGHIFRWKLTYNAREAFHFHELRTGPQGHPNYRKIVQQLHAKVAEVHPIIAEAMKFVNQGEDEALTRLAAERYTQYKLNQLG